MDRRPPAITSNFDPRLAAAVGFGSLDDRFGAPVAAQIPDPHGDIGAGQTVTLRIVEFDPDDDRTLIRSRFRVTGTGRMLLDLSGRNLLASRACAGGLF